MREAQRDDHTIGPNPPPAVCQVPEQHVQAHLDARVVDDRGGRGEVPRPLERARHQPPSQLRVAREACGGVPVEDGEARRLEHPPARGPGQGALGTLALPRTQQVALAEQFCPESALDTDAADQQPTQHEQPDPVRDHTCLLPAPAPAR